MSAVTSRPALSIIKERAGALESEHLVDAVICNATGAVIQAYGDYDRLVFPRSAIKPLQAIALVEALMASGKDDDLSDEDYSVICASHNGEIGHIKAVAALLHRFDIEPESLCCGAHWSNDQATCRAQALALTQPQKIHNNCSGKHAGMAALAKMMGADQNGYEQINHPVQQAIIAIINEMADMSVLDYDYGIDGCGAPAFSAPMHKWAKAFAQFADITGPHAAACQKLREAIATSPFLIAGTGRACSAVNQAYGTGVTVKIGAEGVYAIAAHEFGLGAMLKVRDGDMRIAAVALGHILHRIGYEAKDELNSYFAPILHNWAGDEVGQITIAP